jgi:hypothetical protein
VSYVVCRTGWTRRRPPQEEPQRLRGVWCMVYGVWCIKDPYVVWKYVKKTLLEMGFIWVWVLTYHCEGHVAAVCEGGDHEAAAVAHILEGVGGEEVADSIKDTYVVWKYVKKTLLETVLYGFYMFFCPRTRRCRR